MHRKRPGVLTDEDRALWAAVAAGITPLRPAPASPAAPAEETGPEPDAPQMPVASAATAVPPPTAGRRRAEHRPAPLDRRTRREIARGRTSVEDRIDLHGRTQAAAHDQLVGFLYGAQMRRLRLVLVITGKGRNGDEADVFSPGERGVLRRLVPQWLAAPALRKVVLGFSPAGRAHGGEGAFYVRLRRPRGSLTE